jgi:hypothetical protein
MPTFNSFNKFSFPQGVATLLTLSFLQWTGITAFLAADEEFLVVFCTFFFIYQTWEILTSSIQEFVAHRSKVIAGNLKQMPSLMIQVYTQKKKQRELLVNHQYTSLAFTHLLLHLMEELSEERDLSGLELDVLQVNEHLTTLVMSKKKAGLQSSIALGFRASLLEAFYKRPLQNSRQLVFESLVQLGTKA